jgi:hypothetical protein
VRCSERGRYSITSSAALDKPSGTLRLSALAVLRLMTSFAIPPKIPYPPIIERLGAFFF